MTKGIGSPTDSEDDDTIERSVHLEKVKVRGSTAIHSVDYTDEGILIVYMTDGSKLEYGGVSRSVFNAFQRAPSKGRFFNYEIRNTYQLLN